ncbi:MAG: Hsp20/alpha crystallin family protein [Eubacteriales bacterium]|nr:Hsp20/alpha crystallin family protein [Syntrophorhabdaceae bacterium]MDD2302294.1 Hsp20/alpha crystallin family protein [Eubacteriales bacterium]MDD4196817.1 Hsp20/alpha crystallin family protein [Syntrophorhabdaceae bacterium]
MTTIKITPHPKRTRELPRVSEENPLVLLRNNIDRVFDSFFHGLDIDPFVATASMFHPNVDVADNGKELTITAELPGMDEKDIDVSVTRDALTICGEKKGETEEKNVSYHRMERVYGFFSRTISLPVEVNVDAANADYKKGVLTINIPKTEKALKEAKKIPVKTG